MQGRVPRQELSSDGAAHGMADYAHLVRRNLQPIQQKLKSGPRVELQPGSNWHAPQAHQVSQDHHIMLTYERDLNIRMMLMLTYEKRPGFQWETPEFLKIRSKFEKENAFQ